MNSRKNATQPLLTSRARFAMLYASGAIRMPPWPLRLAAQDAWFCQEITGSNPVGATNARKGEGCIPHLFYFGAAHILLTCRI